MEKNMNILKGKLDPFFETGTEGVLWSLYDEKNKGYESLHILKNGDYLKVFNENNTIHWEGEVKLEYKRNYQPFPRNPQYGQQAVLGYWIHGLQETLEPEFWGKMFFNQMNAELIKKEGN